MERSCLLESPILNIWPNVTRVIHITVNLSLRGDTDCISIYGRPLSHHANIAVSRARDSFIA